MIRLVAYYPDAKRFALLRVNLDGTIAEFRRNDNSIKALRLEVSVACFELLAIMSDLEEDEIKDWF